MQFLFTIKCSFCYNHIRRHCSSQVIHQKFSRLGATFFVYLLLKNACLTADSVYIGTCLCKTFLFYSEKDQVTTTELKGRMDWCPINLATLVLQTLFWVMTVRISSDFRASAENFSQCHHNFLCLLHVSCAVLKKQLKIYNTIYHSLYFHVKEVCRRSS